MENLDLNSIIPIIATGLIALFGGAFAIIKKKLSKVVNFVKELYEIAYAFDLALKDDKITKKEIEGLRKDFKELKKAFKDLFNK